MPTSRSRSNRLQMAALTPIGEAGRTEMVAERLSDSIFAGAFANGERLPSESELARLLGVSVVTVREALTSLRGRGLLETRRGRGGGSFVALSLEDGELHNAHVLIDMSRTAIADLGLHYEMISATCAELACERATPFELDAVRDILISLRELEYPVWRRRVTDVQMELASLSQSVRLTSEHVRVQSAFTPLLALQDADPVARNLTQQGLESQVSRIVQGDIARAREEVRTGIHVSTRWLLQFRARLLAAPDPEHLRYVLHTRGSDPSHES